jgi:hypothetical protein
VRLGTLSFAHTEASVSDWATAMLRQMDYSACGGSFVEVDGALAVC